MASSPHFFRQKYKFLLSILLVAAGVAAYLNHATRYYASDSSLLIRFGSSARPEISATSRPDADLGESDKANLLYTYINVMQSHDLLLPIVKAIGVERLYPGSVEKAGSQKNAEEAAVSRLVAKDLVIKPDPQSPVLLIRAYNPSPELAKDFLARLMQDFTQRQSQLFENPQIGFLQNEVKRTSDELAKRQQDLKDFKSQQGLTTIEGQVEQLMQDKSDARNAAMTQVTDAQQAVDEAHTRQNDLLTTYRGDSPMVRKAQEDVSLAEKRLAQRRAELASISADDDARDASAAQGARKPETGGVFTAEVTGINRRISSLEEQRTHYNDLVRAVQLAELDYKNYESHLQEAEANETMRSDNITRVSVLDQPSISASPARPKTLLVELLGAVAAVLLGLGDGHCR